MINNVSSGEELYCDSFDDSIEQSAIYDKIVFDSVGRELPAIVLTPYCEILHPGKEFLLTVSGLLPAQLVFEEFLEKKGLTQDKILGRESTKQQPYKKFVEEFKEHYLGNKTLKYHFLPASGYKLEHSFIYFRIVKTFLAKELKDKVKIGVLKSPWRESVPSRYAAYSLRIGVPDFTVEFLEVVIKEISTLSVSSQCPFQSANRMPPCFPLVFLTNSWKLHRHFLMPMHQRRHLIHCSPGMVKSKFTFCPSVLQIMAPFSRVR